MHDRDTVLADAALDFAMEAAAFAAFFQQGQICMSARKLPDDIKAVLTLTDA